MLSISHGLTGAFIASKLPHPLLYIPLTLAVHYLEDYIPHWDVGTGIRTGKRKRSTAFLFEIFDLILAVVLVYLFFEKGGPLEWNYHIWAGAFCGLLPDFLEAPKTFLKLQLPGLKQLSQLHQRFHVSTTNMFWGLLPQAVLIGLIWWLK